jgi:hypothetical protein
MVSKPEKVILEYKKALFLKEVGKAALSLGVQTPKVKFWSHYENHFNKGERAHIHIEENLICIAEPELETMFEEDIITTATHEVTHLHHIGHGPDFQNTHQELEIASWEPPAGTARALPRDYIIPKKEKSRKIKPIKYKCNRCEKRTKTKKCPYCESYFCEEHIKPQEPYVGRLPEGRKDDKNTHICSFGYSNYLYEKRKKEEEKLNQKENEALDRLSGKSRGYTYKINMKNSKKDNKRIKIQDFEDEFKDEEDKYQANLKTKKKEKTFFKKLFGFFRKLFV